MTNELTRNLAKLLGPVDSSGKQLQSSFTSLFGPIDHADGNESRSVLSPAAYLVDLLELRDSLVSGLTGYHERRPDVRDIALNQANTFTEIPYLDIANAVMGRAVKQLPPHTLQDPDDIVDGALAGNSFPPPLPFAEQDFRLRQYAEKLATSLDEIERLYRARLDGSAGPADVEKALQAMAHTSARLRLGLSREEFALFSTPHDAEVDLEKLWGVDQVAALDGSDVESIKNKLGLSLKELKQLVRQDLSQDELAEPRDPSKPKRNAAELFFINQGSNQGTNHVVLDESPLKLHARNEPKLTNQQLDRMMRFIRLARRLELEPVDLDWLLQTACGNTLDENGLQAIAIALEIRKTADVPIDELCSLWSVAKDHGQGDGPIPADLFDRVYNNDFPKSLEGFVADLVKAGATFDALDGRLQATLRLSGADFAFLKAALLARMATLPQPVPPQPVLPPLPPLPYAGVVAYFSAFRRIATLSTMMSSSVQEVMMLLDVLDAQWAVSEHDDLAVALPFSSAALTDKPSALVIRPDQPPRRTLKVLQKLFRVKAWLDLRQLSPRQLAYVCLEDHADQRARLDDGAPIDDVQPDDAIEAALDDLHQSIHDAMLAPSALQTGSLTANGAQAVFDSLRQARVLVAFDGDPGRALLRVQPSDDELSAAMESGIHERLEVHASDVAALGITDLDPLFSLLVSHGYLERVEDAADGEVEVRYFIAPGLTSYFSPPKIPSFPALFAMLAQRVAAPRLAAVDLVAAGIATIDVPATFALLQARGYVERIVGSSPAEYRVAASAGAFFANQANAAVFGPSLAMSSGLATFTIPSFQSRAAAVFAALAALVDAPRIEPAALVAARIDSADVPALFAVLAAHGYIEPVPGSTQPGYRVTEGSKPLFGDPANVAKFALPDFTTAFAVLAAKVDAFLRAEANRAVEAQDLAGRLSAFSDQQRRSWLRSLSGLIGLPEDVTELAFAWAFGTPDETVPPSTPTQTLATLTLPLFAARQRQEPALHDAYLASRFRRLQQVALLLRKTAMTADEARVFLANQQVHRRLPETLKLQDEFFLPDDKDDKIDALTTLPGGDFLIIGGQKLARFSRQDHHRLDGPSDLGSLAQILGAQLPAAFSARMLVSGIDAAFSDAGPVLHLFAGDLYVTATATPPASGALDARPISDWGRVRNNIQHKPSETRRARVDAAVQARDGRLFLFSGDQYFLYTRPQDLLAPPPAGSTIFPARVDERYPRSIRGKFESEGVSPLPALMFAQVDAAFRDADGTYYFFAGNRFTHSTDPYNLLRIRPDDPNTPVVDASDPSAPPRLPPSWGHVLNHLFEECRLDAAFVLGNVTYLTRRNQLTRYTGPAYQRVDEGFPISFGNIPESEPLLRVLRRFPDGVDATLAGSDGRLYAFKNDQYASSAAPDTQSTIRDHWGRVHNVFIDNQRVDAALTYNGVVYLFCGDQYVRYSGASYEFVDESYPRRVRPNWNTLENIGVVPDGLPLPITAVAVGRAPGGTSDDVYFFGGNQFAGPTGALDDIKAQWARVRNNIERTGVVDAAMLDGSGRMYLFSGDQYYRYSAPDQPFVDETYPRRLAGNWAQEGAGYSLPDGFAGGISAALRTGDGAILMFSGQSYARVDTTPAQPRSNSQDWGVVRNEIQAQNVVTAAFVDPAGKTYVFGGDQFVRYTGTAYDFVDEGFPLKISTRWPSLPDSFRRDINAALLFRSPVDNVLRLYLFKGDSYVRFSTGDFTQIDAGYPQPLKHATQVEGNWFRGLAVHQPDNNSNHDEDVATVEATYVDTFGGQPRINVFYRHPGGDQWRREFRNGNWLAPTRMDSITDYLPFTRLDAAFVATDGTLYAFSGNQYASRPPAGGPLTAPAQIRTRWARVFNQFADLGRVDACLAMPDGRTYLFCARQFIKYTGALRPGAADFFVDEGYPLRIDPNWPNQGVPVALVAEFQAAGYDLCRDATGQIHFFNGTRYVVSGTAGDVVLTSRWGKVENRFKDLDRVDAAYRAENSKLYLFCDTQYTRYSGALQPGSPEFYADEGYPRHVTTGWSSEGVGIAMPAQWNALGSAVFRDAQQTYVFSGATFTSSQMPTPALVIPQWAKVRNQIQSQNRVDAGFVLGTGAAAVTLVFCDDQYVRYSAGYDGFVDEGYPKVIAHLTAADGAFPGLPVEFQSGLRGLFAGTDGKLHVFGPPPSDEHQPQLYASSDHPDPLRALNERWGIVDNKLWDNEFVDAALLAGGGKLFLFSGDQYVRYSGTDRRWVDESYPRRIASSYAGEIGVAGLSPIMNQGIDAALTIDGTTFYFIGDRYVATDHPDRDLAVVDRWGIVDNQLQARGKLDAGFVAPSGKLYLFAGTQVSVYSGSDRTYVDEEWPRTIEADLGVSWPHDAIGDFRTDLDAAAGFEGRSYLFKGGRHVRISDFRLTVPDAGYPMDNGGTRLDTAGHPRDVAGKYLDRFDFELGTLPDWWRIKQLFDDFSSQTTTVLDYLDASPADPVPELARATQWPVDEIIALQGILALAQPALLDGRALVRLARCFELADRIGTTPFRLKSQVWDPAFVDPAGPLDSHALAQRLRAPADFLYGLIKVATDLKDWPAVARSLLDAQESAKRDALVAYLVDKLTVKDNGADRHLRDANELYERLLTDIQMDASSSTSLIVEAINSIQLYYHRALIDLEDVQNVEVKVHLQDWWPWMKNFRIWEANRKVFLHPENYIRPELRPVKSPAFEDLEQKLLQDEITPVAVEEAYQRYLEAFHEVARLRVAGGYHYDLGEKRTAVFMVGFARTSPPTYYYRRGTITETDHPDPGAPPAIDWEPWRKMGITIDAEHVQLVYVFNKLFAFWIETTPFNDTNFKISLDPDNTYSADSESSKQVKLQIKFSYYNFNNEWVAPQTVVAHPDDKSDPESIPTDFQFLGFGHFRLGIPAAAIDRILLDAKTPALPVVDSVNEVIHVKLEYLWWEWEGDITAGLDLENADRFWRFRDFSLTSRTARFPSQIGIKPNEATAVIPWGSPDPQPQSWLSFDAKGGSFLCRPTTTLDRDLDRLEQFSSISAAFTTGDDLFVFTTQPENGSTKLRYHQWSAATGWLAPVFVDQPEWPWGRPRGVFDDTSKRIDNAILARDGKTYVMVGPQYFTYLPGGYTAIEQHFVTELPDGPPGLDLLVGDAEPLSWSDSIANGRALVNAFKQVDGNRAVLVTQADKFGHVELDLDQLRELSKDGDGNTPFADWDRLDAVFWVSQPEARAVFSRDKQLVILHWPTKQWSPATLGELPGHGARLATAFTGSDGKLYLFSGVAYSEADPAALGADHAGAAVATRWGRPPSLFTWLVSSVDGALIIPDGGHKRLYLFCKHDGNGSSGDPARTYCLRYSGPAGTDFTASALDTLRLDDDSPQTAAALWIGSVLGLATMDVVTAAFERSGTAYLYGLRNFDHQPFTASYSHLASSPYAPDGGTTLPILGILGALPVIFGTLGSSLGRLSPAFYTEILLAAGQRFAITRLTSHTSEQFSKRLFAGGITALLALDTQKLSELPRFTPRDKAVSQALDELIIDTAFVSDYPGKALVDHPPPPPARPPLDFTSANGFYYEEIFFHIPYLIAQSLKQAQHFSEAKTWYEYVFNPTAGTPYWQYIQFRTDEDFFGNLQNLEQQIRAYQSDPFDPHKIAALRPLAYRKAFAMSYIDNLLEWGDNLFRQYTRETIGEATMLYVLAGDLLGKRPEELGKRTLSLADSLPYSDIRNSWDTTIVRKIDLDHKTVRTEEILELENSVPGKHPVGDEMQTPHDSIFNPYFYIPENEQFVGLWDRVDDRLFKIRHGLNIDGVKQALALFAPPVDVLALVRAFASGAGIAEVLADYAAAVPHYRFTYMVGRARDLTGRLIGLGNALLSALENKDAEELSLLRNTHERSILDMQLQIKQQQLESAKQSLAALQEGLKNAQARETHYQQLLTSGLSTLEQAQIASMVIGQVFSQVANVLGVASSVAHFVPQVGSPWAMTYGGIQVGSGIQGLSQAFKALSEMASFGSSLSATLGGWERRAQDWELQKTLATGDILQIGRQIKGAEIQVDIANQEIQVQRKQIKNNQAIDSFMTSKFTSKQLYQFMVGKLSAVYFQTYHLALGYAKAAQRAMQFELGLPESDVQFIGAAYWDSLKKGLTAGEQLQLDLDRLEKFHCETNERRMEITRYVSLAQVDPLALVRLKERGTCEFELTEALFDSDFPGHYCRQIKTVSLSFPAVVAPYHNFNATLTQLGHRTLLAPDKKALKYLLQGTSQPAGQAAAEPPATVLRVDWRPNQQVALSTGVNDDGMFQANYYDERYLPFEGTGALSTWRLEINGVTGPLQRQTLSDVVMTVHYTARVGGSPFAEAAKNAISGKSRESVWLLDLAADAPDSWQAFMSNPSGGLSFTVERRNLPGAADRKVTGVYLHYELAPDPVDDFSRQAVKLNGIDLKPNVFRTGVSLPVLDQGQNPSQATWKLMPSGSGAAARFNPRNLRTILLVVTYLSKPAF